MCFPNRSDTIQAVHAQKMARGLRKERNCTIHEAKPKVLISFAVTVKLICTFGFAYADGWFSHDATQIFAVIWDMFLIQGGQSRD